MKKRKRKKRTPMEHAILIMLIISGIFLLFWAGWGISFAFGISSVWLNWLIFSVLIFLHVWMGRSWWVLLIWPDGTWISLIIWAIFWPAFISLRLIKTGILMVRRR